MSDQWYYTAAGQQVGPLGADDLRGLIASGKVAGHELAWREGMSQWTAISSLPELLANPAYQPQFPGAPGAPIPVQPGGVQLSYGGYEPYAGSPLAGVRYGGFWIRVGAALIDGLILAIPNQIISTVVSSSMNTVTPTPGSFGSAQLSLLGGVWVVGVIVEWLYGALMESSSKQATLGKMACGLIVTDEFGKRLTFGRATGRHFAKVLSSLTLGIGYIMVGTDPWKRGLHDRIAKTFVVMKNSMRTGV